MSAATTSQRGVVVTGVQKTFGGVHALDNVDLEIRDGQALGLVGENGAGKSTLIGVLTGAVTPDHGVIALDGIPVEFKTPHAALERGIGTVHQQNWLVPELTVAQNVELGREVMRTPARILSRSARDETKEALRLVGLEGRAGKAVRELSLPERQLVAIARASARGTRLMIFDEPTAALSPNETSRLFDVIDGLRETGRSVLYVTHRLEELDRVVDEVVVMRAGAVVGRESSSVPESTLVGLMAGRDLLEQEQRTVAAHRATGRVNTAHALLEVDRISDTQDAFRNVSFTVRAGEIVGLVGLPDSGAAQLVQALAGARRLKSGEMHMAGKAIRPRHPRTSLRSGIGYLPGDRKQNGVIPNSSVRDTITLSALSGVSRRGVVKTSSQKRLAAEMAERCGVRAASLEQPITALSGGNQQKALFARTLATKPRVVVCEDPTAGVDPAGREALYELLTDACSRGNGIVLYSTDLREIAAISDRALVFWRGELINELPRDQLTVEDLMAAQFKQV